MYVFWEFPEFGPKRGTREGKATDDKQRQPLVNSHKSSYQCLYKNQSLGTLLLAHHDNKGTTLEISPNHATWKCTGLNVEKEFPTFDEEEPLTVACSTDWAVAVILWISIATACFTCPSTWWTTWITITWSLHYLFPAIISVFWECRNDDDDRVTTSYRDDFYWFRDDRVMRSTGWNGILPWTIIEISVRRLDSIEPFRTIVHLPSLCPGNKISLKKNSQRYSARKYNNRIYITSREPTQHSLGWRN